jgi:hypothetical protein
VSIHAKEIVQILDRISRLGSLVKDFHPNIQYGFDETMSTKKGLIRKITKYPNDELEMIWNEIVQGDKNKNKFDFTMFKIFYERHKYKINENNNNN